MSKIHLLGNDGRTKHEAPLARVALDIAVGKQNRLLDDRVHHLARMSFRFRVPGRPLPYSIVVNTERNVIDLWWSEKRLETITTERDASEHPEITSRSFCSELPVLGPKHQRTVRYRLRTSD